MTAFWFTLKTRDRRLNLLTDEQKEDVQNQLTGKGYSDIPGNLLLGIQEPHDGEGVGDHQNLDHLASVSQEYLYQIHM